MLESFTETFFLLFQYLCNPFTSVGQLRIGNTHFFHQISDQFVEEWLGLTQFVAMPQSAAGNTTQYITTTLITRNDAVDNQEACTTNMIGDDFQRVIVQICATGFACSGFDQVLESIDFVVGMHMLQYRCDAFQAHTRVNAWFWQWMQNALLIFIELHENQVPYFDETVTVFVWRAWRTTPNFWAVIIENFAARTAWTCVSHLPEIIGCVACAFVIADTDNALNWHTDLIFPDVVGFVVFLVDRDRQFFFWQAISHCQQFPRIVDRIAFEVIAKREVTQHFKESVVARGIAYVFQIVVLTTCAHAALRRRCATVAALVLTQEHVFKLHHTGVGKQQSRIVTWYQAR